jgi:hypothetical protein
MEVSAGSAGAAGLAVRPGYRFLGELRLIVLLGAAAVWAFSRLARQRRQPQTFTHTLDRRPDLF